MPLPQSVADQPAGKVALQPDLVGRMALGEVNETEQIAIFAEAGRNSDTGKPLHFESLRNFHGDGIRKGQVDKNCFGSGMFDQVPFAVSKGCHAVGSIAQRA